MTDSVSFPVSANRTGLSLCTGFVPIVGKKFAVRFVAVFTYRKCCTGSSYLFLMSGCRCYRVIAISTLYTVDTVGLCGMPFCNLTNRIVNIV